MVEGGPGGRPAVCCEAVSALDGGRLLSWVGLGYRRAVGIMDSFAQGCQTSPELLYYMR